MAVHEHKGIENIPESDRCPECGGVGWVRYEDNYKKQKSHPCLKCGGNGERKSK
jgi:DnaJ-class molecular chaperone